MSASVDRELEREDGEAEAREAAAGRRIINDYEGGV
jgi:hypothetical protein